MEDELASISLMEHLSEPGFRASVIATYNCYFPFYEEVVLRRLVAAGCTHNVLMMDAARCAEAFASEDRRPRRAGRDYTLIPVEVGGAFHPKILLRVGKSKGALFVGSHNLTLSGFGLNDEVTTVFRAQGASIRGAAAPFRGAFEFLAGHVPSGLPDVVEAYEGLKLGVPWLEGPVAADAGDRVILTSSATGADLWSQIVPRVPRDVATAFVCAPFFDPKPAFARRLLADVRPREAVIGIDPASPARPSPGSTAIGGSSYTSASPSALRRSSPTPRARPGPPAGRVPAIWSCWPSGSPRASASCSTSTRSSATRRWCSSMQATRAAGASSWRRRSRACRGSPSAASVLPHRRS
ncbi:hypothetical protein WME76_17965 [Sorangium sp. So ce119]|uniref:hypothetical protein n=1 Tax=Sorangium sp. So ce119 TaxID=3133279 RepID=UPI003F5DE615